MVIGSATGECCDISGTKIPEFTCVNPLPFPPQPDPPLHHNIIAGAYNVWYFMGRPYDENGMLVPQGYITFNVVNPDTGVIHDIACGQIGNIQKLQCLDLGPE